MLKDVEYKVRKLESTLDVLRDVYHRQEQDLEELRQAMRIWRRNRSQASSGSATQGPQNPSYPEKTSSPKKTESQSPPSSETMEDPSTPPPRPSQQTGYLSGNPKRKAPEDSELRSMKEHRDTTPSRLDPFPISFDSPRRRNPLGLNPFDNRGDFDTRPYLRRPMPWLRDERERHFMRPMYTQKTQDKSSWDKLFRQTLGPMSPDLPKKPSGTDPPPERTQEGDAGVLLDEYEDRFLKEAMESMDKDEPSSDKTD
ncbi:hypothetical protein EV127DRAFT_165451 [Xylaria flabelliformis]|nr:hypothetical protein EV127DRAFT_165451 [Xylaria flabelliformis]